jgi:bifunctional non-homologous end joining protein LigD
LVFYAFDLLYLDTMDLRGAALLGRKQALEELLKQSPPDEQFRYSEHTIGDGSKRLARACKTGFEGIVSKRSDGRYHSGRTDVWMKATCRRRDTFVVAGWAMKGSKFDGFYLGEAKRGHLVYAGKIEQGWTEQEKKRLLAELEPLRRPTPAIDLPLRKPKARWVEPRVLVDVEYRAKTGKSGLLRHPSFKGVRRDLMEQLSRE